MAGEGRGDADAYASYDGVRSFGLTGTAAGVSTWSGHPVVAVYICSIGLIYVLMICCAVFTALYTKDCDRRKAALKVLKILTGTALSLVKAESASRAIEEPAERDPAPSSQSEGM